MYFWENMAFQGSVLCLHLQGCDGSRIAATL
jgi:hypothetical protein